MPKKTGALGKRRLGELLVEVGIIAPEQLQSALDEQQKTGDRLGDILIRLGFVTQDVVLTFIGKQCGVPYVSLAEYGEIPSEVIKCVPETVVRHQLVIPLAKENRTLTVAMADPLNVFATDDLRLMTGYDINVVIASEEEIKAAVDKYYGAKGSMEDVIKTMEKSESEMQDKVEVIEEAERGDDIIALERAGEDAPIIKMVNIVMTGAVEAGASDIHIEPYEKKLRVRYRIDGVLHGVTAPPKRYQNAMVSRVKIMAKLDIAERRLPQDGRIKIKVLGKEVDLRVSVVPTAFGEKVVMRLLDTGSLCLDLTRLGFESESLGVYQKNINVPYGIVLDTGPTGSGKTTTLYSTLYTLNAPDRNIITIEDPVEYILEGINQVAAKPDIGLTFAAGLRSFLRQDPDVIMVGEIRDTETAEIAINAALTGHLVFSTLHTNDAAGAVTRLTNMGIEPFLTSSTVVMVIAQRLVRLICEHCKESYEVPVDYLSNVGVTPEMLAGRKKVTLYRGRGCDHCTNTGYRGRSACFEVMEITDEMRALILDRAPTFEIKKLSREQGMLTLREAALRKLLKGHTTVEEVLRVTFADTQ